MPAKSVQQFKAMQAAAHGKSTLGIPASVGKEFVAATPKGKKLPAKKGKKKGRPAKDPAREDPEDFMERMRSSRKC
jgi:hypothetical protein